MIAATTTQKRPCPQVRHLLSLRTSGRINGNMSVDLPSARTNTSASMAEIAPWQIQPIARNSGLSKLLDSVTARQKDYDLNTTIAERKARGHFGTPSRTADFMARMFTLPARPKLKVLDAGAGVGILSAAVCGLLGARPENTELYIEAWESDPGLEPHLIATLSACQREFRKRGRWLSFRIVTDDFILGCPAGDLFDDGGHQGFDLAILNPPYFKLRKESPQARIMPHVVHGQPNIYALFMARAADLLVDDGEMIAITPRSYFNGPYFRKFRKWFLDRMTLRHIHLFNSRSDVFQESDVLQENVIIKAIKRGEKRPILITSSEGRNYDSLNAHELPHSSVVDDSTDDHIIKVRTGADEPALFEAIESLPCRFRDLPYQISTGPVVTFRSRQFLRRHREQSTAPLFCMHNVRPFVTRFPPKHDKPAHILVTPESTKLLLPSKRYVLMKRFTAKEERRRLVAGILESTDSYSPFLGLENHLNYICMARGELTSADAYGIAGYLNSSIVDRYFRAVSGNTQVNASEIRTLPVPALKTMRAIGEELESSRTNLKHLDSIVGAAIGLSKGEIELVCGAKP